MRFCAPGGVAPIDELLSAARIHDLLRLPARTMEIQIRIEAMLIERMDVFGVRRFDILARAVARDPRIRF